MLFHTCFLQMWNIPLSVTLEQVVCDLKYSELPINFQLLIWKHQ